MAPQKGECFLDDFEALVREIDVPALVLQNATRKNRFRALLCGRDMILKIVRSKTIFGAFN
jgi:hypothetical protein